jgi:DNA replication protein DnaC
MLDKSRQRQEQDSVKHRAALAKLSELGPQKAAESLGRYCQHCGKLQIPRIERYKLPWLDEPRETFLWPRKCGCPEEAAAVELGAVQLKQQQERQAQTEWEQKLERAGLDGWLGRASFDNFAIRDEWPQVGKLRLDVLAYADALLGGTLEHKPWLILYGDYGTGKSHLAAAVVRAALEAKWPQCYFRVWTEYLRRLQNSWDTRGDDTAERQGDIEQELSTGRMVVIDDLDKRRPTGWSRETLFTALNHRYNLGLPTILTFNWGPEDADPKAPGRLALEEYLGRAMLDRLIGSAWRVIEFRGPSYRSGVEVPVQ